MGTHLHHQKLHRNFCTPISHAGLGAAGRQFACLRLWGCNAGQVGGCSPPPGHRQQVKHIGTNQHSPSVGWAGSAGGKLSPSAAVRWGAARHLLTERNVPKGHRGIRQNLWLHRRLWKTGGLSANVYMLFLHCYSPERTCSAKVQRTQERSLLTLFINSISSGRSGFLKG